MPVLKALWEFVKRQTSQIIVGPQCYAVCNNAAGVYQSIGKVPALCDANGDFSAAMSNVYSCSLKYADDTADTLTTVAVLEEPLEYCANLGADVSVDSNSLAEQISVSQVSVSLACYSYQLVGSVPPSSLDCASTTTAESVALVTTVYLTSSASPGSTASSTSEPTTANSASSAAAAAASSSAAVITPSDNGLSKGAIAGIAVGATIGVLLLIAFVAFFIWRHRRNRKTQKATAITTAAESSRSEDEKAQLHSDDYKPPREEMQGSKPVQRIRTIEGLHEVEYQDLSKVRSEMSANEVAASELEQTNSSRVGTDSTLLNSSTKSEGK